MVANSGLAIDEKGELQEWRYIHSFQKSIWVKDQGELPASHLEDKRNDLVFRRGKMLVQPFETAKLAALKINDVFAGNDNPVRVGASKEFYMVDQEAHNVMVLETLDATFEAEKVARSLEGDELLALASLFAIDLEQTDASIRTQLIIKSRELPAAFIRSAKDNKTKVRFLLLQALQQGIIETSTDRTKVLWSDTKAEMCLIKTGQDVVDDLVEQYSTAIPKVLSLVEKLKALVEAE